MNETSLRAETTLRDYWHVLGRRRWTALTFLIVTFTTVALGTFLMTPLYRSETKIIVESESTNVASPEESSASMNYDIYENYLETQMALIKSEAIAGKVFEEFELEKTPRYRKRYGLMRIFRKHFEDDIYLERLPGTRMIILAVENPNPQMAADLANRLSEFYSRDNLLRRAITFIRNQRMSALNAEFLRLQGKLDSMANQFGPKHPDMIALREEIRAMANRIQSERLKETGSGTDNVLLEDQALLEDTLSKIQESSVMSSSRMNNIGIVDVAHPAKLPFRPKVALNLALGAVAGLVGGILLAFFIDYLDDTVKTEDELKRYLKESFFLGALLYERPLKKDTGEKKSIEALVADRPESASAEAYRLIRTRILWSISKGSEFKDLGIISSIPGEGKTTVASNLAISLAQLNMKTLLVDTDLRRGRLHETYGFANDRGLGHVLSGDKRFEEAVQTTRVPNLSLVTCGESVIDSSQLFSSSKMEAFIKDARAKFDIILYDTPPMTIIADTAIFLPKLHGALLVVRSGVARTRILSKAVATLKESGANLLGVVFNASHSNDTHTYSQYYSAYNQPRR